jgi:hypothetical protein
MEMNYDWFDYSKEKKAYDNVYGFVKSLPKKFEDLLNENNSNIIKLILQNNESTGISLNLFKETLKEAERELKIDLIKKQRKLKLDTIAKKTTVSYKYAFQLREIGFSQSSIELKALSLNRLWNRIKEKAIQVGQGIIDFAHNEFGTLIRKFFALLNSVLGSLAKMFTGLEPLKEFKDILESYFGFAEVM